jgi:hypothetical protein
MEEEQPPSPTKMMPSRPLELDHVPTQAELAAHAESLEHLKAITIMGANSDVGAAIASLMGSTEGYTVTALQRASSKSAPPPGVSRVVRTADKWEFDDLVRALREAETECLIMALGVKSAEEHILLGEAAREAGVKRVIPADFGSLDARDPTAQRMLPLFQRKVQIRKRLEQMADTSIGMFSWSSLVCGHLFDWGLKNGFLHVDLKNRSVEFLDDGNKKFSASTLARVAEGVHKILDRPIMSRNRVMTIESFAVSQREIHASLERVSGEKWSITQRESQPYIAELKKKADEGDHQAVEDLVYALGVVDGNLEEKRDHAMRWLGLEKTNLDDAIREVLTSQ